MSAISVIVPVYKVEPYLRRCIDSILNQSFVDLDLVLVDDGSPDGCGTICDEYGERDSRVHVIHQKNGGLSAARNAGIDWVFAHSDCSWITFVDSDDWIHPGMLEILWSAAMKSGASVSICGYQETAGEEPIITLETLTSVLWRPEDFYIEQNVNAIVAWGKLYNKELFSDIRYPNGKIHEDELTTYKILFSQEEIVVIPLPLYYYFQNAQGITKSSWSPKRMDAVQGLKEQAFYFRKNGFWRAQEFASMRCAETICTHKKKVKESGLPQRRKYVSMLNRELWGMLVGFWKVYTKKRNLHIFCIIFPVLELFYELALAVYIRLKKLAP